MEFSFSLDSRSPAGAAVWQGEGSCGFVTGPVLARYPALQVPLHHAGWQPPWWLREPVSDLRQTAQGVFAQPLPALPAGDLEGRALPVWYKAAVPREGMYAGAVTICGAGGEALVFVGRRRLAWRGVLDAGQTAHLPFAVDVVPLISEGDSAPYLNLSVDVSVVGAGLQTLTLSPAPESTRRVFLLGDSTVTDQSAAIPYAPGTSYAGWGEMLPWFLPPGYCVSNHAHSGLTTESFTTEGHWALAEERLRPGDLVLMQFGHNDQKMPHLDAKGGYTVRLRAYLDAVRAKGALPVLVTPLARNSWTPAGLYNDLLADYAAAVQRLGQQTHTLVIDLHQCTREQIVRAGREGSKRWFYPRGLYPHQRFRRICGRRLCGGSPDPRAGRPRLPTRPLAPRRAADPSGAARGHDPAGSRPLCRFCPGCPPDAGRYRPAGGGGAASFPGERLPQPLCGCGGRKPLRHRRAVCGAGGPAACALGCRRLPAPRRPAAPQPGGGNLPPGTHLTAPGLCPRSHTAPGEM